MPTPHLKTLAPIALLSLSSCTAHLFSSIPYPDNSQPVVKIETRGGVEYGVGTEHGILFLGRTAESGPCRVHYYLGPTVVVESGLVEPAPGLYFRADIDLKHQRAPLLVRPLEPDDQLVALLWAEPELVEVPVQLAGDPVTGDLLADPGRELPPGTGLFVRGEDETTLYFVGLVAGTAALKTAEGSARYVVFTGIDRQRELLLQPLAPVPPQVKHRPDNITVIK